MTDTPTTVEEEVPAATPGAPPPPLELDLSEFQGTAFPLPTPPARFIWRDSQMTRFVLESRGLLDIPANGDQPIMINGERMLDHVAGIVLPRMVTDANLPLVAELGIDQEDVNGTFWGLSEEDKSDFPVEWDFLTDLVWPLLTNKGALAKSGKLPAHTVMVESPKHLKSKAPNVTGALTRIVVNPDGTKTSMKVQVRFATNVPERALSYVSNPAAQRAVGSLLRFAKQITADLGTFPDPADQAMFIGLLQATTTQVSGVLAPVYQQAGLSLTPASWSSGELEKAPKGKLNG
jgi:hypothetical protein